MKCKVTIFCKTNEVVSSDIWYGASLVNVKYWVDLAIKDLIDQYRELRYEIEEII